MTAAREIKRLQYLQAMGVTAYVSRRALPGAAMTHKLAIRPAALTVRLADAGSDAEPGTVPDTGASSLRTPKSAGPAAGLLSQQFNAGAPARSRASADHRSVGAPSSPAGPGSAATDKAERFRLTVLVYAKRLWVEDLADGALATQQLQLIAAIGRALVHPPSAPLAPPLVTQFDWPIHNNAQLDLGAGEAAATLQGFLHRQIEENGCVELMCLGEPAQQRLRGLQLPCARRELPGTQVLLEQPLRKRELWAALRA